MSCASASGDGLYVAIARDHELSLYTVEPFAEIARTSLEPGTERTVVFVGRQVLVHEPTRIGVYALPRLSVTAKVELGRRTRLHATSSHYALLVRDGEALVVACTSEGAALAPTRTPAHVDRAVGLEVARFLIWPKQGPAEIWDAVTRLPVARIGLELPPDASAVGATAKHRSVWITTRGGELIVSRLSDGKTTIAPLPRQPVHVDSHPGSAWLVMDFDGEPHAVNTVLRSWQPLAIPPGRPRALAPGVGAHAYVVVDEGDEVTRREIAVDAVIPNIVSAKVGAPLPEGEEVATTPPSPISRVERARIDVAPVEVPPVTTPAFLHARAPAADAPSGTAQTTAPPARIVNPPPSDGGPRLAARFERRVDTPLRQRPFTAAPPRTGWQEALVAWATRVLGDEPSMPLPTGASPLAALADRAQLDAPARRILAVLYADWLGGHGEVGLAGSKLVDLAGPTAWEEALGKGQLGLAGLVSSQVGRCLLARPIGAFLDGRSAEAARHVDGSGQRDVPDGWYRASVTVEALAARLGPVATCEGAIVVARLEAWARGWPLVVAAPPSPPARPGELVVVTSDHASLPPLPGVSPPQPT